MAGVAVKGRGHYHHGDLRRTLIAASLDLINEVGPDGFTLREVARRAGVSHTAPYRHFRDKEALLGAVAQEGFEALAARLSRVTGRTPEPLRRIRLTGATYVRFALNRPAHFRVMFARDPKDPAQRGARQAADRLFERLIAQVAEAQAKGEIGRGPPREQARAGWALMHGFAQLALSGQVDAPRSHYVRLGQEALELLIAGLAPRNGEETRQ